MYLNEVRSRIALEGLRIPQFLNKGHNFIVKHSFQEI